MSRTSQLFILEANLRGAAEAYAAWMIAPCRTSKILNEARSELRAAAIAFANIARSLDG